MKLSPMLATLAEAPLKQKGLVYEPKYDGIRALVEVAPSAKGATVHIWSRNGNEKTAQFPAIAGAIEAAGRKLKGPIVLDGEIVALDERGRPAGFQLLQGRMHLKSTLDIRHAEAAQPAVFIAFDILRDGKDDLTRLPLTERRARLEQVLRGLKADTHLVRLSEQVKDDATAMHARAKKEKWEGLIAKEAASTYQPGRRTPAWRKLKLQHEQEFVIGGWTEPRQTRQHFGALLLGVQEDGRLKFAGNTGTGFDEKELARVSKLLKARETRTSPFSEEVKTSEPAHWVRPDLVAQVRFTEWTADDKLRHPVYLGLRDDKAAREVVRESVVADSALRRKLQEPKGKASAASLRPTRSRTPTPNPVVSAFPGLSERKRVEGRRKELDGVLDQLRALEDARKDGEITLPNGDKVKVTNPAKPFWSGLKITKGDLLRYYVEVSPYLLPCVEDRPLVMKRFPNGVDGKAFYQQRAREERPPAGVRIETLTDDIDPIGEPDAKRLIGGSLTTLLYMTQIAAISQDPWFSRVQSPLDMDHCAIDLDPTDGVGFDKVLDVARWVRDELASLKVEGIPKTSGASGMHVYVPLPKRTSYESGQLFCQIVATVVASRHPKVATVERMVKRRPRGTVYVDFLQNILGKTLAIAYSARASEYAGVSTPLTWKEVDGRIDPRDFTIRTAPARFAAVGDLWKAGLRAAKPADLETVFEKYQP